MRDLQKELQALVERLESESLVCGEPVESLQLGRFQVLDEIKEILARYQPWEPETDFDRIAVAIGHHFWRCETDSQAYDCGLDAAKDVAKALQRAAA